VTGLQAHIAGIPVEETLGQIAPAAGATVYALLYASKARFRRLRRNRRRRTS